MRVPESHVDLSTATAIFGIHDRRPCGSARPESNLHRRVGYGRNYEEQKRRRDEMMLRFKLAPGEAYVIDNYRLLHGRTAIVLTTGRRHLRQCYMDRDIVSSRQKVLRRRLRP